MPSDRLRELLKEIIDAGCSCDIMNSYRCGIHDPVMRLDAALTAQPDATAPEPACSRCGQHHNPPRDANCARELPPAAPRVHYLKMPADSCNDWPCACGIHFSTEHAFKEHLTPPDTPESTETWDARAFVGKFHAERVGGDYDPELILCCLPGLDVQVELAKRAYAPGRAASGAQPPTEMFICEIPALILHRDQAYIFRVDPNCEKCANYLNPPKAAPAPPPAQVLSEKEVRSCWRGDQDGYPDFAAMTVAFNDLLRSTASTSGKETL